MNSFYQVLRRGHITPTFTYKIQTCNITKVNPTKLCNVYKWKKDLFYVQVAIDFSSRKSTSCTFIDIYSGCREPGGLWLSCVTVDITLNLYLRIKTVRNPIIEIIYTHTERPFTNRASHPNWRCCIMCNWKLVSTWNTLTLKKKINIRDATCIN